MKTHVIIIGFVLLSFGVGCTSRSTKIAREGSRRCDEVGRTLDDNRHKTLVNLELEIMLAAVEKAATSAERERVIRRGWNTRQVFEDWLIQTERMRALHYATVDAKLASMRSIVRLMGEYVAEQVKGPVDTAVEIVGPPTTQPAGDADATASGD